MALMLCSTLFMSCSNNDSDEEMQALVNLQEMATGGSDNPVNELEDPVA